MKYPNKCPVCNRRATRRFGRLKFCDDCAKDVKRTKRGWVYKEVLVFTGPPRDPNNWLTQMLPERIRRKPFQIFKDIPLKVHRGR